MDIRIEKKTIINDETDWLIVAPPKGGLEQWKDGRSAKEFARFVTKFHDSFSKIIKEIVENNLHYTPESLTGEPEAKTDLPPTRSSGPRNHDLLLFDDRIVIGIEAKVDEPFGDKTILQEKKDASKDKAARIEWLKETILPEGSEIEDDDVKDLRYQLFTATAGTLLAAYDQDKSYCIFLVLSFHQKGEKITQKAKRNKESFDEFVKVVCSKGQCCQKFTVKRDGETEGKSITCWFIEKDIAFTPQTFDIE